MTFRRLEEVDASHWRIVLDGAQRVRRTFEIWVPRDASSEEIEEFMVQVVEIVRRRRTNEQAEAAAKEKP